MPLLAGLLQVLFGALGIALGDIVARKLAIATAAVATLGTITGALLALMHSVVIPLQAALFSSAFGAFLGLAFPPIANTCITAIATTWAGCTLYAWKRKAIDLAVQA